MVGVQVEHGGRVERGVDGGNRGTLEDRDGAQVSSDRVVDGLLEQFGLGAIQGFHGLDRDAGLVGDAAHGGAGPAEALEGILGGGHNRLPGARGGRRPLRGVVAAFRGVDGSGRFS